ncbi:MAG: hypothetical protein VX399_10765 [SAR324 cluster bacterium]|nr:hypothetical protein [SAR324 cluster bacterium]
MRPENLVEHAHAIVLSGGSTPGLESANGVSNWLRERKRGFPVGGGKSSPLCLQRSFLT